MRTNTRQYSGYVQQCSDAFKQGLNAPPYTDCSEAGCEQDYKKACKYCLEYSLNDTYYRKCTCVNWGCVQNSTVFAASKSEIDTYLYFLDK